MNKKIKLKLDQDDMTVGIIGLGYVGLPLALNFSMANLSVIGFEANKKYISMINTGKSYISHISHEDIKTARKKGLAATNDYKKISKCDFIILVRVTLRVRIANPMVKGSCYRGGIVHIRFGYSCALLVRRPRPKALWRFRVSTSNSPSGRTWPPTDTHLRYIHNTYAQQDIRVYEDDHFQPRKWQFLNPKAL